MENFSLDKEELAEDVDGGKTERIINGIVFRRIKIHKNNMSHLEFSTKIMIVRLNHYNS